MQCQTPHGSSGKDNQRIGLGQEDESQSHGQICPDASGSLHPASTDHLLLRPRSNLQIVINPDFTTAADSWWVEVLNGRHHQALLPPMPSIQNVQGCVLTRRPLGGSASIGNIGATQRVRNREIVFPNRTAGSYSYGPCQRDKTERA